MKLNIYYDAETDTLSVWNGVPASEGEDVAEHLVADFNDDGDVVGFTLEHAGEVLKADLSALGRLSDNETDDIPSTNGVDTLGKFANYQTE